MSETMIDPDKFKLTCLIPKNLIKRVKQNALDDESNITAIVIKALEDYLTKNEKKK